MAKILYGVHGTGHGHAIRALAVARHFREHEFLFVSHGQGAELLRGEYPVETVPNPVTPIAKHQVVIPELVRANLHFLWNRKTHLDSVRAILARFRPDIALSDYEYTVPRAARAAGVPCLSVDNQHLLSFCRIKPGFRQWPAYLTTLGAIRFLFSQADEYLITSFFQPPETGGKVRKRYCLVPPLLRQQVLNYVPTTGQHVVAYQGYSVSSQYFRFLKTIGRPVYVYGGQEVKVEDNLHFKSYSESGFLADLAACAYVICGGGHTLIGEALHYGKPVLALPVTHAFEQWLNAVWLAKLGYGSYATSPGAELLNGFEAKLDQFRTNIARTSFCGNDQIFTLISRFLSSGSMR